jgi:hypothetical protein
MLAQMTVQQVVSSYLMHCLTGVELMVVHGGAWWCMHGTIPGVVLG